MADNYRHECVQQVLDLNFEVMHCSSLRSSVCGRLKNCTETQVIIKFAFFKARM